MVLGAVNEELERSGRKVTSELTADDSIDIIEREQRTYERGIAFAQELAQKRGLAEGLRQIQAAAEQANQLTLALTAISTDSTKKIGN